MMVSVVANSAQAWEKIGTGIIRETVIEVMDTVSVLDGTAINKTIVMAATHSIRLFKTSIVLHTATVMLTEKLGIIKTQQPAQNQKSSSSQFRPFRFNIDVSVY